MFRRHNKRLTKLLRDLERIPLDGICTECGSWRCPDCQWLIINWWDHKPGCSRETAQRQAEEGY